MIPILRALLVAVVAVPFVGVREMPAQRLLTDAASLAGQRVRVTMRSGERMIGQLVEVGDDSLSLQPPGGRNRRSIARSAIKGVSISRGIQGNVGKGLAFGAGGGLVLGAVLGAKAEEPCRPSDVLCGPGLLAFLGGMGGLMVGGAVGIVVGALVQTEKWLDIALAPSPRVTLGIMNKGVGIRILTH